MKWPEEERRERENSSPDERTVDSTFLRYQEARWRRKAVSSIRKLIQDLLKEAARSSATPCPPEYEQIRACLDAHDLPDVVDAILPDDSNGGMSMSGALLVEAAGGLFCNRPSVLLWQMVGQIIENDRVALRVLAELVELRISKRGVLREDIRKVGRAIIDRFNLTLSRSAHRSDSAELSELHEQWQGEPDLHDIWFGLQALGAIMPSRSDWHIFDLLFKTDIEFAAELIEMYNEPYQPAQILQLGALNPNLRFGDWKRLIEVALPAFESNGEWNGHVLLPLLLLSAQDGMRPALAFRGTHEDDVGRHDAHLAELAETIAMAIWARPDGGAATLHWGGWLFRSAMSELASEPVPFPLDADSRARPAWLTVQALIRPKTSTVLATLRPKDVAPEDEMCLEAVRILAAQEHDSDAPGRDLLFQMLPREPEDFLEGESGRRRQELPSLFVIWGKRADAFGTRVLAAALFDQNVAARFKKLWHCTLTLRELVEHGHAFANSSSDDHARRASETIRFVIALGINLIDYVQDVRQTVELRDRRTATLDLFSMLHDAIREMLAIDPIGRRDTEQLHNHLCVRRLLYEGAYAEENAVAAPLEEADEPTVGDLLYERCEVSRPFFENLQMLRTNRISRERIERALDSVGIQLDSLIEQAQRLNAIEHNRTIDLTGFEVAALAEEN